MNLHHYETENMLSEVLPTNSNVQQDVSSGDSKNIQQEVSSIFDWLDSILNPIISIEHNYSTLVDGNLLFEQVHQPIPSTQENQQVGSKMYIPETSELNNIENFQTRKRKREKTFTSEEMIQIQNQMKKPKAKYKRVQVPYQSMCNVFKFK